MFFLNSGKGKNCNCSNLESFLYKVSYNTTWIGGFSLWKEDRDNIRNNLYACDTFLWQVTVLLNSVIKHGQSYIITEHLFDNPIDLNKLIVAYNSSLYTIFYENYFRLIDEIIDKNPISQKCYEWLKKDLLFNFFTHWLILYKLQEHKTQEECSLTKLVLNAYKKEYYFPFFYFFYVEKLILRVLKNFIIKILK